MTMILVVDDELSIVDVLSAIFEDEGYEVATAFNGQQAITRLREKRPDVVLCDLMMPQFNGQELCQWMKSQPEYRAIPFVLMTAVGRPISSNLCPYTATLTKPFEIDNVIDLIDHVLKV